MRDPVLPDLKQKIRNMTSHCNTFKGADVKRAWFQLITTSLLFFFGSGVVLASLHHDLHWLAVLCMIPTAGLLVRLFIIQHDCGHGSFLGSRRANDFVGRLISVLTLTPYDFWRQAHNMHHASSGNLDRRGIGSIDTLTVEEYKKLPRIKRLAYRLYRNPIVLLVIGTPVHVILIQRFPVASGNIFFDGYRSVPPAKIWRSVMLLNVSMILFYGVLSALIGLELVLLGCLPVVVMTAWIGGWLFFIQHQFEETSWHKDGEWNFHEASVLGSSYYVLPKIMQWFTGNIGMHHIHHLCPAIPNYRLQECLDASSDLQNMNRMTFTESLKCVWWTLWDEKQKKMITFRDLRLAAAAP